MRGRGNRLGLFAISDLVFVIIGDLESEREILGFEIWRMKFWGFKHVWGKYRGGYTYMLRDKCK